MSHNEDQLASTSSAAHATHCVANSSHKTQLKQRIHVTYALRDPNVCLSAAWLPRVRLSVASGHVPTRCLTLTQTPAPPKYGFVQ